METAQSEKQPGKLNDIQISLLRLFNRDMPVEETAEVRQILMAYYDTKLQDELARVVEEKKYTKADFDAILNQQNRTATNQQIKQRPGENRR